MRGNQRVGRAYLPALPNATPWRRFYGWMMLGGQADLMSVRYNEKESILNRKKSVAYRHSGLRPGIQETFF